MATNSEDVQDLEFPTLKEQYEKMGARPKETETREGKHRVPNTLSQYLPDPTAQQAGRLVPPAVFTVRKPWLIKFTDDHGSEGYDIGRHQLTSIIREIMLSVTFSMQSDLLFRDKPPRYWFISEPMQQLMTSSRR